VAAIVRGTPSLPHAAYIGHHELDDGLPGLPQPRSAGNSSRPWSPSAGLSGTGTMSRTPSSCPSDTPRKVQIAKALYQDKRNSVANICWTLQISLTTFYRYMKE
jgi:hypothetical protein